MPNDYFQFKQFRVEQSGAAMKVCTDACIFGAWVNEVMKKRKIKSVLDIGAGTGLLSLMLAQETKAGIDAVEIDHDAYEQMVMNFTVSPWKDRLFAFHTDIRRFETEKNYDLIISNPPFFSRDLKSPDNKRSRAMHESDLKLDTILDVSKMLLSDDGYLALLMPYSRLDETIRRLVYFQFHLCEFKIVKRYQSDTGFRIMVIARLMETKINDSEDLIIKESNGVNYTKDFIRLLKPYYLKL